MLFNLKYPGLLVPLEAFAQGLVDNGSAPDAQPFKSLCTCKYIILKR